MAKFSKMIDKGIAYFRRNGVRGAASRAAAKLRRRRPLNYEKWLAGRRMSEEEYQSGISRYESLISAVRTVNWGDQPPADAGYVLFQSPGSCLEREALLRYAIAIEAHPQADLFYGDSDRISEDGRHVENPCFKPDFDPYLLLGFFYIGSSYLVAGRLLREAGGGIADPYDVLLRCAQRAKEVVHIPHILCHESGAVPGRQEQIRALEAHFARCGISARILEGETPQIRRICYRVEDKGRHPLISVLIPSKDHTELLKNCLDSLKGQDGYEDCEVLILENNSADEETFSFYEKVCSEDKQIRVVRWEKPFNFSAINNFGASRASGDYLLFLNNDTRMKAGCLRELLQYAAREDVGAVGARLFYPDGTIQHAGVIVGYGGLAGHAFEGMDASAYRKFPWVMAAREYSAVTAACMMVPREVFLEAGGFCEELQIAYNDVDLCLRIRSLGKKVIYNPYAELVHFESKTRGLENTREKAARVNREADLFRERWREVLRRGDRHYNPNLTLEEADFSLKR